MGNKTDHDTGLEPPGLHDITKLPLVQSATFQLNGKPHVQLGNAARCCVCVMPADSDDDFALIAHVIDAWALFQDGVAWRLSNGKAKVWT